MFLGSRYGILWGARQLGKILYIFLSTQINYYYSWELYLLGLVLGFCYNASPLRAAREIIILLRIVLFILFVCRQVVGVCVALKRMERLESV